MKLYKLLNALSLNFSLKFLYARLPVSYVIFNKIFNKRIINTNIENKKLREFNENGFVKLDINFENEIDFLKKNIKCLNPNDKKQLFEINDNIKSEFKEKLIKKLNPLIKDLQKYYNSNIIIANVEAWRNVNANVVEAKSEQLYANHYHNDGYLMTYFKLHINMMDVNEGDGPLHIVYKNKTKEFFKNSNYKNRNNYTPIEDKNLIYKNVGKKGDCFLFSSPECIHKAGVPNNFREMIQVQFIATANRKLKTSDMNIYDLNEKFVRETSKPYGLFNVLKILNSHFKYKRENKVFF